MSHIPQRKEKDCLNCGTQVIGRYCHQCGQENVVPKETFWHMVTHFFYDIVHFDSKFFASLKVLIFKPGLLSLEYMKGRRARYLHPIKMYVFTSAIFFLLFFSVFSGGQMMIYSNYNTWEGESRLEKMDSIEKAILEDSVELRKDTMLQKQLALVREMKDTTKEFTDEQYASLRGNFSVVNFTGAWDDFKSVEAYEASQRALPEKKRDGWLLRRLKLKELNVNVKTSVNPQNTMQTISNSVLRRMPYMLFISLPLFALILRLLYFRRKNYYYADHGVFTIHLYIFSFINLIAAFTLTKLKPFTGSIVTSVLSTILLLLLNFYLYKAMRRFYAQRRAKTIIKFILTTILSLVMMMVLFLLFMIFSAFEL